MSHVSNHADEVWRCTRESILSPLLSLPPSTTYHMAWPRVVERDVFIIFVFMQKEEDVTRDVFIIREVFFDPPHFLSERYQSVLLRTRC